MFYLIGLGKVFFTVCGVILVTAALTTFGWEATIVGAAQTIISVTGLIILTVIVVVGWFIYKVVGWFRYGF